jgi:hypothetical protein
MHPAVTVLRNYYSHSNANFEDIHNEPLISNVPDAWVMHWLSKNELRY